MEGLGRNEFIFACSIINVSYFLMQFFHIFDFLDYKKDKKLFVTEKYLKSLLDLFLRMNIFFDIHCLLLTDLFLTC
jgi:hypothetical protein